ncbi:MAG: hypothetical protein IAE97_02750 [Chthoniobacterales bacterium]|nr:hypothetical protein [Chthoniobacterales bacterium]
MRILYLVLGIIAAIAVFSLLVPNVISDGMIVVRGNIRVMEPSGDPIPNATVVLRTARSLDHPELFPPPKQAISTTDEDGNASVWAHFPAGWSTFRGGVRFEGAVLEVSAVGFESITTPYSEQERIRYWTFWSPHISKQITLSRVQR